MNTIILFWDQMNSSFDNEIFKGNIAEIEEANRSNSSYSELYFNDYKLFVNSSQRVEAGDRFFVFCYGGKQSGIYCSGYLASDYYEYEEQYKDGRIINDLDLIPDFIIHPDYHQILSVEMLKESIPDIEWSKINYGRFITKEQSTKIDSLWHDFLEKNSGIFDHWSAKQNYDFDFFLPQEEEMVYINLTDNGKFSAWNYRCDLKIECDDIETTMQMSRDIIRAKYGESKKVKFEFCYYFCDNNKLVESFLKMISNSCKDKKDQSGRPIIEQILKSSLIDTLAEGRIIAILLRLIEEGLIREEDLREEGIPDDLLTSIHILIKGDKDSYDSYIEKVAHNKRATNYMIDVLDDRLKIIFRYKELKKSDFDDLNKWLKAYHKLSEVRRSGFVDN